MKILLINKFYYLSGGAERYLFEWEDILRARGHDVSVFSMRHPLNRPCKQEDFFTDQVRFAADLRCGEKMRAAAYAVWNPDARRAMRALLDAQGTPDVAHLQSFIYQLTPACLGPLLDRGVPIVQTCHEYAHICPNQRLYSHRTNRICEACLRSGHLAPLWTRCIKGSFTASAVGCAAYVADRLWFHSRKHIRLFLATSAFMRRKLIQGGLSPDRVIHVPNFIDAAKIRPADTPGDYLLFFGRLVVHKGIGAFLKAAARLPDIPCKILGGGPLEKEVRAEVGRAALAHVEVLGHRAGRQVWDILRAARAVVTPSEWYEPFGLVILEAMAAARPVIACRIAGPGEIVTDGDDGLLAPPGDDERLAEAMQSLWNAPDRTAAMGRRGRRKVLAEYTPEEHYRRVASLFEEVTR